MPSSHAYSTKGGATRLVLVYERRLIEAVVWHCCRAIFHIARINEIVKITKVIGWYPRQINSARCRLRSRVYINTGIRVFHSVSYQFRIDRAARKRRARRSCASKLSARLYALVLRCAFVNVWIFNAVRKEHGGENVQAWHY